MVTAAKNPTESLSANVAPPPKLKTRLKAVVMINAVLRREWPRRFSTSLKLWSEDEVHAVVEGLKSLDELNG